MKYVKFSVTIALLAVLLVLVYYYITNKERKEEKIKEVENREQIAAIVDRDIENNYPVTVREVVNLYTEIQKCYYNFQCSDEDLEALADQAYKLMDEELIAHNPREEFMESLKTEIDEYKSAGRKITSTILDKSTDVVYYNYEDRKNASINCTYFLQDKKATSKVVETYVLRKDDAGRWKIYGYKIYEPEK